MNDLEKVLDATMNKLQYEFISKSCLITNTPKRVEEFSILMDRVRKTIVDYYNLGKAEKYNG